MSESNCNIEKQLLYGKDIQQEKFWSQENSAKDKIFFQAGDGSQGFGMTDELLSKHLLLLGGIGSGKTTVPMLFSLCAAVPMPEPSAYPAEHFLLQTQSQDQLHSHLIHKCFYHLLKSFFDWRRFYVVC